MGDKSHLLQRQRSSASYGSFNHFDDSGRPPSRDVVGTEIFFHEISYSIPVKLDNVKTKKDVLNNVSGFFKPGLNAILGPTGSGKTTLLDIVAGRKDRRYLSGLVLVNGQKQPQNFKLVSGYVIQEDVVLGTLTVRENLSFSAALRLSKDFSKKDRDARVQLIIEDLGLVGVADSMIGTEFIRGVSGGERKRACIGMELITSPDVLFLDEPTTGLDASTACHVMDLLSNQARKGRNIIFSIHQPRYSIFKLFDTLTLLSEGNILYHGRNDMALQHFSELGYVCEQHNNPPDFFLDIINRECRSRQMTKVLQDYHVLERNSVVESNGGNSGPSLADRYMQTQLYQDNLEHVRTRVRGLEGMEEGRRNSSAREIAYQTSFFKQFVIVLGRATKNAIRNPQTSIFQLIVNVVLGVVVGGIYYQLDDGPSGLQNRVGLFFFQNVNMFFSCMSALEVFIKERRIFIHECANGYYRVSAYFFAKTLIDIIPLRLIPVFIFSCITYWMIGLRDDPAKFGIYTAALGAVALGGAGMAFLISSLVQVFAVANLLMILPSILMFIFSGLIVNLKTMRSYISWLKYFSVLRYGLNILSVNELDGMTFRCAVYPGTNITQPCPTGAEYLAAQGVERDELWTGFIAIGSIFFIFLLLTYIQLRRIKKET